ncbi:MAG: endonuclease III, partial [Phycisphaerae bacterium]|nr:endonuclease III [Phycisphaerae bacterium]
MSTPKPERVATPSNPPGLKDVPFRLPKVTPTARRRSRAIFEALRARYPHATCALHYSSPHELLIATILSAQSTDAGVNKATPALFREFPTPADYAAATPEQVQPYIRTIGLYRNKSKSIVESMRAVVNVFQGQVP